MKSDIKNLEVKIPLQDVDLLGDLSVPNFSKGLIIFAHGSGSSRKSPRNRIVAKGLNQSGFATLLFDLLTQDEESDRNNVFNLSLLSKRLYMVTKWAQKESELQGLAIGYFGASTGAAAALMVATQEKSIFGIVSRGGRPDLAFDHLKKITSPVLLIVGENDKDVIRFNEEAKKSLKNCDISIVPDATHLFEEPGALERVMALASFWFDSHISEYEMKNNPDSTLDTLIRKSKPFKSISDMQPLIEKISKSKVVMLGEATHGTEEFYSTRKMISKKLIEDYGFDFIAVEGDWPDCYNLNKYITSENENVEQDFMRDFKRWPTWLWANEQIIDLVKWMKGRSAGFYGLDVYSLYESLDQVRLYTEKFDEKFSRKILKAYACLDSFNRDEIAYARSLVKQPKGCEKEIQGNMRSLMRLRLQDTELDKKELFDIQQNAKVISNAEQYYRAMIFGKEKSWNIRDQHMMDTLESLYQYHGPQAKGIVWAHNTHIGDYHATNMVDEGYINLGGLAREHYGADNVSLVGFGTYQGEVLASQAWGDEPEKMNISPAFIGSYESDFHQACKELNASQLYILMNGEKSLATKKGHRAIGVVYQDSDTSNQRNFVPTKLSERYDSFIFIDETTSLNILPEIKLQSDIGGFPETWPAGV